MTEHDPELLDMLRAGFLYAGHDESTIIECARGNMTLGMTEEVARGIMNWHREKIRSSRDSGFNAGVDLAIKICEETSEDSYLRYVDHADISIAAAIERMEAMKRGRKL